MPNDLNQRSREVAELIEDWEQLFNAFNVPTMRKNGVLYAKCPDCGEDVKVQPNERRGFSTWQCECGAHKKYYDSYLGLMKAYNPQIEKRGVLLGEVESWALKNRQVKALPGWAVDFGKYKGHALAMIPPGYAVWAAQNCSMPEEVKRGIFEAYDLPDPLEQDRLAKIPF